jgi:flagellar basal body L-ring protein FlgH
MKAFRILSLFALVCFFVQTGWPDTLWSPGFDGYLTGRSAARVGDIVYVEVDGSSRLSFQASRSDARNLTLEFSGGEFGNLFSFLPNARSGGEQNLRGRQEYALRSRFAARVVQVDETGKARVQGTRSVSLESRQESLTLTGWLDPADLGGGREVRFSQLADSRLSFRTLLQPAAATLTAADIQAIVAALAQPPAAAAPGVAARPTAGTGTVAAAPSAGTAAPAAPAGQAPAGQAARPTYQLADSKRLELFLRYVNQLIDLLFQQ